MRLKAKSAGFFFTGLPKPSFFKTRHVFNRTVYLSEQKTDKMFLVSAYSWRSPYTINIPDTVTPLNSFVEPLSTVCYDGSEIRFSRRFSVTITGSPVYKSAGLGCGGKTIPLEKMKKILAAFSVLSSLWRGFEDRPEYKRVCEVLGSPPVLGRANLDRLIGLGGGFTPSGDDFLSGYIGSLVYYMARCKGKEDPQIGFPEDILGKTTWASRNYILYSLRGVFDELAENTLYSLFAGDILGVLDGLIYYSRRGHESGLYIWLGLITGYSDIVYGDASLVGEYLCLLDS